MILTSSVLNIYSQEFGFTWTPGNIGVKYNIEDGFIFTSNIFRLMIVNERTSLGLFLTGIRFEANNGVSAVLPVELAYHIPLSKTGYPKLAVYGGVGWGFHGYPFDFSVKNGLNYNFGIRLTTSYGASNREYLYYMPIMDPISVDYNSYNGINIGLTFDIGYAILLLSGVGILAYTLSE